MHPFSIPHWIDNAPYPSSKTAALVHPNTLREICQVSSATSDDIGVAITSSQTAFPKWAATSVQDRRTILLKAASLLKERKDEFTRSWQREMEVDAHFSKSLLRFAPCCASRLPSPHSRFQRRYGGRDDR